MALKTYNNNDKNITNSTYSSITFSNGDSRIMQSRFSISYFNKLMKVSIALRNNAGSKDTYATFDTDNQVSVYVSNTKAAMLSAMVKKMLSDSSIHNVCVELKNGLLKVSDGSEYGSQNYCISISYADESGNVNEVIYETKSDAYSAAYNYRDGQYSSECFKDMELNSIIMTLDEYYKASSYALAATVMEASMYKRNSQYEQIRAIAEKVGAQSSSKQQFNNKTFLSGSSDNSGYTGSSSGGMNGIPKEYEASSFDSIAGSM